MAACYPVPFKTCRLGPILVVLFFSLKIGPRLFCPYCVCLLCAQTRPHCSSFFLPSSWRTCSPIWRDPRLLLLISPLLLMSSCHFHRDSSVCPRSWKLRELLELRRSLPQRSDAFSFSSALTKMIAEFVAHSFFADSSLFWSIRALLSHYGFCFTSPVSASLAILRIAMSAHCPCFTIACGLLTSRVLPLLFSPDTYSIQWLTIAHVRSSLFWSASFHYLRLWLWFFLYSLFSGVASCDGRVPPAPLFGSLLQRGPLVVPPAPL